MAKHVVVIGGGTGTFTLLSGLKKHPVRISAIVTMADDGGSTGMLRDELGVLPPGDIRQCLVALSRQDLLMRKLMNYRFENGGLKGHSFGNLLLSALEKITGSFDSAVEKAGEILRIEGQVIPATLEDVRLVAEADGRVLYGEHMIDTADLSGLTRIALQPAPVANPKALSAIADADAIVVGPGDFYTSLVPILLIKGIQDAIAKSKARKIFICNLMNKKGHTDRFCVSHYAERIESYLGSPLDVIVYNTTIPPPELMRRYKKEGQPVKAEPNLHKRKFVGRNLLRTINPEKHSHADLLRRSLIRHDPERLARLILKLI